jgi:hypothetical protein
MTSDLIKVTISVSIREVPLLLSTSTNLTQDQFDKLSSDLMMLAGDRRTRLKDISGLKKIDLQLENDWIISVESDGKSQKKISEPSPTPHQDQQERLRSAYFLAQGLAI